MQSGIESGRTVDMEVQKGRGEIGRDTMIERDAGVGSRNRTGVESSSEAGAEDGGSEARRLFEIYYMDVINDVKKDIEKNNPENSLTQSPEVPVVVINIQTHNTEVDRITYIPKIAARYMEPSKVQGLERERRETGKVMFIVLKNNTQVYYTMQ